MVDQLKTELKSFFASMRLNKKKTAFKKGAFLVEPELPSNDFNRDIYEPGKDKKFPLGAVAIYCDENFYPVAGIPYKFKGLTCKDIVSVLWPNIVDPVFYPDNNDPWWEAKANDEMEVPNEPWEAWLLIGAEGASQSAYRLNSYGTAEAAQDRIDNLRVNATAAKDVYLELRHWQDGMRKGHGIKQYKIQPKA